MTPLTLSSDAQPRPHPMQILADTVLSDAECEVADGTSPPSRSPRRPSDTRELVVDRVGLHSPSGSRINSRKRKSRRRRPTSGFQYALAREVGTVPSKQEHDGLMTWAEKLVLQNLDNGKYLELDRESALVRSTISIAFSCNGRYFASTHGDHTVKVFEYPEGRQVAFLEGHPRTPWIVRFHPNDPHVLATGCLGNEVRIWNHVERTCMRMHTFQSSISCVSFHPDGSLLAVTSGRNLMLWEWEASEGLGGRNHAADLDNRTPPGMPRELLNGMYPYHMVDFHPSGNMLMTGEKNKNGTHPDANPGSEEQFTLKVVVHRFNKRIGIDFEQPVLEVPRVVAYNDAGIHFSPCGTMLAACIPGSNVQSVFRIAILSLVARSPDRHVGKVLFQATLDAGRTIALTNLKFSPSSTHLLAGYSFRRSNPVLRVRAEEYAATIAQVQQAATAAAASARRRLGVDGGAADVGGQLPRQLLSPLPCPPQINVVDIYELSSDGLGLRRSLTADVETGHVNNGGAEDEINVAVFAPTELGIADGVVYGTQKGRVRVFQQLLGDVQQRAASPYVDTGIMPPLAPAGTSDGPPFDRFPFVQRSSHRRLHARGAAGARSPDPPNPAS